MQMIKRNLWWQVTFGIFAVIFLAIQIGAEEIIQVENSLCPVSLEAVGSMDKSTVVYEGKEYNVCCEMCVKDFKKDPEKYIKKLGELEEKSISHEAHS